MARRGRTRKPGARERNGRLSRKERKAKNAELKLDDRTRTSRQPHRRVLKTELRTHEEAESPIGRLLLAKRLRAPGEGDDVQARHRYDAGTMFAAVVGAYRSVIEAPNGTSGSGRGFGCLELRCRIKPEDCECRRRRERYEDAFEALAGAGRWAVLAVNHVAVHREPIGEQDLVYLTHGLSALARHFRLTDRRRGRSV